MQLGQPAAGVAVKLEMLQEGHWRQLAQGVTGKDGRLRDVVSAGTIDAGVYRLTFNSGSYFADRGTETFYPQVTVTFEIKDGTQHHHVPLLLSPYGYTTYRGS